MAKDEGLLTDAETQSIRNELIRYINIDTSFGTQEMCRAIAKAQLAKVRRRIEELEGKLEVAEFHLEFKNEVIDDMRNLAKTQKAKSVSELEQLALEAYMARKISLEDYRLCLCDVEAQKARQDPVCPEP